MLNDEKKYQFNKFSKKKNNKKINIKFDRKKT